VDIDFTVIDTDLGQVLIAATAIGLCKLSLGEDAAALERELRAEFPAARITAGAGRLKKYSVPIRDYIKDRRPLPELPLDLRGTVFQLRVWQALQSIPYGQTRSYGEIAESLGAPQAVRAVAGACGRNPVALAVPCHRVIGKHGELTGYRWGKERKKALLERETPESDTPARRR
jgi:AraC family transcriptional regulator of adaptative response/methylated-DNA-[protein]-cysteine methyltransferase